MKTLKNFLLFIFPIALLISCLVTIKWIPSSFIDGPNLYGLLYPYRSDALGSSFAYEVYIKGILLNAIAFLLTGTIIYWAAIRRIEKIKIRKRFAVGLWIIASLIFFPHLVFISEFTFKWDYNFPVDYNEYELWTIF